MCFCLQDSQIAGSPWRRRFSSIIIAYERHHHSATRLPHATITRKVNEQQHGCEIAVCHALLDWWPLDWLLDFNCGFLTGGRDCLLIIKKIILIIDYEKLLILLIMKHSATAALNNNEKYLLTEGENKIKK